MSFRGTTVVFYRNASRLLVGIHVEGHSNYAEAGLDIVCAAVSAITWTICNGLENVLKLPITDIEDENDGMMDVQLKPETTQAQLIAAQPLMETMLQGLQQIHRDYPQNVRIIFKERR